jgi:hypothetical protein
MAKRVVDVLQNNMCTLKQFMTLGIIPQSVMVDYKIYSFYQTLNKVPSKMARYTMTAETLKVSEVKVRRAVSSMEKKV